MDNQPNTISANDSNDIPFGDDPRLKVVSPEIQKTKIIGGRLKTRNQTMDLLQQRLDKWASGQVTHLSTGFESIDSALDDFLDPGRIIIVELRLNLTQGGVRT